MSGEYVHVVKYEPPHHCEPPRCGDTWTPAGPDGERVGVGTVWRCECGKRFVVIGGPLVSQWDAVSRHEIGPVLTRRDPAEPPTTP